MSNKAFDTLRFIQSIIIPIAAFITGLSKIFGFEFGLQIAAAIALLDGLLGAIVQAMRTVYNKKIEDAPSEEEPAASESSDAE